MELKEAVAMAVLELSKHAQHHIGKEDYYRSMLQTNVTAGDDVRGIWERNIKQHGELRKSNEDAIKHLQALVLEQSDFGRLTALFKDWGVHYEEAYESDDDGEYIVVTVGEDERSGKKVDGYVGFFSDYRFNKATGKFITMGAWE